MLNYYVPFYSVRQGRHCPGVTAQNLSLEKFLQLTRSDGVHNLIEAYRGGDATAKAKLPAVCYTGYLPEGGKRKASDMKPTGLFIVDIDHCEYPSEAWENILKTKRAAKELGGTEVGLMLAHITPSGKGLRLVFKCPDNATSLASCMEWVRGVLNLDVYGDFDECVHDVSRLSFIPMFEDILFMDNNILKAPFPNNIKTDEPQKVPNGDTMAGSHGVSSTSAEGPEKEEANDFLPTLWLGKDVQLIIDQMFIKGLPCKAKSNRHESSLKLASDLLVLLDGDRKEVEKVLRQQSWVQEIIAERGEDVAQTITSALQRKTKKEGETLTHYISKKMNTAIKALYGKSYYELKKEADDEHEGICESSELQGEETETKKMVQPVSTMPTPPPVIRELISIAPEDFVIPTINALMPILGTLTSYVRAEDKANAKTLSTSFFSILYAPPSSGKSFVERYINILLRDLFLRDEVNDARDAVFARSQQKKSANDRGEAVPQTSVRIMEAKNSEAEFLEKQRANAGHHMFTYCSEIDQWRKGIRAAGGNKDDMVRIAWDNGKYGQNFKSANTFKGKVQLFWNLLIAGTSDQLMMYFKNVTNGLVTRCCFTEIENQQFQERIPQWGKLSAKDMKVIDAFIERCDRKTYQEPLAYNPQDCYGVSDEDFDKEVPWHFAFKPFEQVSIDWINKTIEKFNREQCNKARIDSDEARDTFRRRVAERGKRLALLCTQLYAKPMTKADKELCKKWIAWWMVQDIEGIMKPFGKKYIEAMQEAVTPIYRGKTIYERVGDEFSSGEVKRVAEILGYSSQPRYIISQFVKAGVAEKIANDTWRKIRKEAKHGVQ